MEHQFFYSINSKQQLNLLFNIAIFASIITVIEFFLAQYASFLPDFIRYFVSSDFDFFCIDDDNIVSLISMRLILRLMLSFKHMCNFRR